MTTAVVKAGSDSWIDSVNTTKRHGDDDFLKVKSGEKYAMVYLANPAPHGTTAGTGTVLRLTAKGASTGSRTITAALLSRGWDEGKVHYPGPTVLTTPAAATVSIGTLADGDHVDIPVDAHIQSIIDGTQQFGWQIATSSTTAHQFYAFGNGNKSPRLIVNYDFGPPRPIGLSPAGTISVAKPRVKFDAGELAGAGGILSLRVQIDPAPTVATDGSWTSPAWDSGTVISTVPELDLSTTSYPGLSNGSTTKWHVGVLGSDGTWAWSLPATITRTNFPTLTITNPQASPNNYVTETTPPMTWTFTTQAAFQVQIYLASTGALLYDSTKKAGTDQSFTLPANVIKTAGENYTVKVTTWDTVTNRVAGDASVTTSRTFTYTPQNTVTPATTVTATQIGRSPGVTITATRGTAPDAWQLEVDGKVLKSDIDPADSLVTSGTWAFDYWSATAFTPHVYKLVPVVNGVAASGGPTATLTTRIAGAWLVDAVNGNRFNLLEVSHSLAYAEDAEVTPKSGQSFTRKTTSMRGLEGEVNGILVEASDFDSRTLAQQLADLFAIKGGAFGRLLRWAYADMNIRVLAGAISPAPSTEYRENIPQRAVSYWIGEDVSDLPYTVVIPDA